MVAAVVLGMMVACSIGWGRYVTATGFGSCGCCVRVPLFGIALLLSYLIMSFPDFTYGWVVLAILQKKQSN